MPGFGLRKPLAVVSAIVLLLAAYVVFGVNVGARQIQAPRAESLRFQLIGNEPIAAPDGRGPVAGWAVLLLRDRTTSLCYAVFREGPELTSATPVTCPP